MNLKWPAYDLFQIVCFLRPNYEDGLFCQLNCLKKEKVLSEVFPVLLILDNTKRRLSFKRCLCYVQAYDILIFH